MPVILAGDIGGTNTRLAVFDLREGTLAPLETQTVPSHAHRSLEEIAVAFVAKANRRVDHACFGIAGPVKNGRSHATNLPWIVDAYVLAKQLKLPAAELINDLEANAYGIAALGREDLAVLSRGESGAEGNMAVISAGTGLGEAGLTWDGRRHQPFATEGGHADFAPGDDLQIELLRFLMREFGHVSVERVLSGPGLHNIYRFLRDVKRGEEPPWLAQELQARDAAAVISTAALDGRSELCARALDLFVAIYGAEAGNLALKVLATGGLYVGGGIAPRILPKLKEPRFMRAFSAKGRLAPVLEAMPVRVILNDQAALLGAARCAALRASLI